MKWSTLPTGKLARSVAWWMHHCIYVIMEKWTIYEVFCLFIWCFFFFFLSLPCPCLGICPGNKECERISDDAKAGCGVTLAMGIVQCVWHHWRCNSFSLFVPFTINDLSQRGTLTDPHMTNMDSIAHWVLFHQSGAVTLWWQMSVFARWVIYFLGLVKTATHCSKQQQK